MQNYTYYAKIIPSIRASDKHSSNHEVNGGAHYCFIIIAVTSWK